MIKNSSCEHHKTCNQDSFLEVLTKCKDVFVRDTGLCSNMLTAYNNNCRISDGLEEQFDRLLSSTILLFGGAVGVLTTPLLILGGATKALTGITCKNIKDAKDGLGMMMVAPFAGISMAIISTIALLKSTLQLLTRGISTAISSEHEDNNGVKNHKKSRN